MDPMKYRKKRKTTHRSTSKKQSRFPALVLTVLLLTALFAFPITRQYLSQLLSSVFPQTEQENTANGDDILGVHFIDVGQGDSILLLCGGEAAVIDGGGREAGETVSSYLQEQGVQQLKYIFCTHSHEDHCGGLSQVLEDYPTQAVYCSSSQYDSRSFHRFVQSAAEQNAPVTVPPTGSSYSLGSAVLTLLGPREDFEEINDQSLVLRLDHGYISMLFTGDLTRAGEKSLLESNCDLNVDLLKVGHHGSNTSSSYEFLWNVMPRYAVISVGAGNPYGHPHEEVLSRLTDARAEIYRTDLQGSIVVLSDGKDLYFQTERSFSEE